MALFKIFKGDASSSSLAAKKPNTVDGYCYVTIDNGKMYIDIKDGIGTATDSNYRIVLNAESADKLTCGTVGSVTRPIYFKNGIPTITEITDWFKKGINIPENSDLDTYNTIGKYYCNSTSISSTLINSPVANDNFVMFVLARTSSDSSSLTQIIITLNSAIWMRGCASNGVWREWINPSNYLNTVSLGSTGTAHDLNDLWEKNHFRIWNLSSNGSYTNTPLGDNVSVRIGLYAYPISSSAYVQEAFIDGKKYFRVSTNSSGDPTTWSTWQIMPSMDANTSIGSVNQPVYFSSSSKGLKACTYELYKTVPANAVFTDTHYLANLKVGSSSTAKANASATNGNVYLNLLDNNDVRDSHNIKGTGATTVISDNNGAITINSTDTKNTAGSTDISSKIFLIGATSQAANSQTYSHDTAYVGSDGCLYSGGTKVSVSGHTHNYLPLSGGVMTGRIDANFTGARFRASNGTNTIWFGLNAAGDTWGLYDETNSKYLISSDGTNITMNGNAATASKVAWSGITNKPSYYDAKAIKGITRNETTFTYTCMDGSTGTFTQQDNDTTYSAGEGISLSGTTFSNSGVRSAKTGSVDGTISVNINGTDTNIAVYGLGSAAYTESSAYDIAGAADTVKTYADKTFLKLTGGTLTGTIGSSGNINLYNTNPYLSLSTSSSSSASKCYIQIWNPVTDGADNADLKAGFGFTKATSLTIDKSGNVTIPGDLVVSGGDITGNASSATKLKTARTLTIGATGKTFNGTGDVTWTNNEVGFLDLVDRGVELADGADLNTVGYGNFYSNNSTKSATLVNGPLTSAGFRLISQKGYNSSATAYHWQYAMTSSRKIYQRYRDGDGNWSEWGTFVLNNSKSAVGSASLPVYVSGAGIVTACTASSLFSKLSWTAGTSSGPVLNVTVAGEAKTATIPSASASASGIVTNTTQTFAGTKTFNSGELKITRSTSIANNYPATLTFNVTQTDNSITSNGSIKVYDDHDAQTYGTNMVIQSAGNMIIGSGEAPNACYTTDLKDSTSENTYIVADGSIYFYTNCNTYANKKSKVYINTSGALYGAVWNDYAEFRICKEDFKPGQVVCENNDDTLSISTKRLQPGANIVSDTYGFAIGETDEAKCPITVSGRVLAYTYEPREEFKAGEAVCAGPNGTVSKMTREEIKEYPERIIGTVSAVPNYEIWGEKDTQVNGRIWIKVK